jgi:DNA polymerase-4
MTELFEMTNPNASPRKIIHVDMDAFFASVEQRDFPQYRGKALAVGGSERRGVVMAASYEARKFGVRSAMPAFQAREKCPEIIFAPPRFDAYVAVSRQIMSIFKEYTDLVEPMSLDEAFLDVTVNKKSMASATLIARELKMRIRNELSLTASCGVSFNKFLAKVASDYKKPDGLFVIKPEDALSFIDSLAIEKFFGVGKVTASSMHELGISNGKELREKSRLELEKHFGKFGSFYFDLSRGIDNRKVNPDHIRKSIGAENTFEKNIEEPEELLARLMPVADEIFRRMEKSRTYGSTITLKIKYSDFSRKTKSITVGKKITDLDYLKTQTSMGKAFACLASQYPTWVSPKGDILNSLNYSKNDNKKLWT